MFRSAILHNSSSVHACSVAPLLEITKYINMHDYINTLEDIVVIFALKSSNFHFKLLGFFKACIKCRLIHKSIQDNYCFKIEEFLDL